MPYHDITISKSQTIHTFISRYRYNIDKLPSQLVYAMVTEVILWDHVAYADYVW